MAGLEEFQNHDRVSSPSQDPAVFYVVPRPLSTLDGVESAVSGLTGAGELAATGNSGGWDERH